MTSDDEGEGGVTIPPKNDDVIYEQPLTSLTSLKSTLFFIEAPANLGEVTRVDAHCKVGPHKGCCKQNLDLGGALVTLMSIELKLIAMYRLIEFIAGHP